MRNYLKVGTNDKVGGGGGGVRKVANVKYWLRTVVMDNYSAAILKETYFYFRSLQLY